MGGFQAYVSVPRKALPAVEFVVFEGSGDALLGKRTVTDLGILSIKADITCISTEQLLEKYDSCFGGIVPYHIRDRFTRKLKEL